MAAHPATTPTQELLAAASGALMHRSEDLVADMASAIKTQEPMYRRAVNYQDLRQKNRGNLQAILKHLREQNEPDPTAAHETGTQRAREGMPLPAVLRAYHIGTNMAWMWLAEYVDGDPEASRYFLSAATELWNLNDHFCQEMSAAYRNEVVRQRQDDARTRAAALAELLHGNVLAEAQVWDYAQLLDLPAQGPYVVASTTIDRTDHRGLDGDLRRHGAVAAWLDQQNDRLGIVPLSASLDLRTLRGLFQQHGAPRTGLSAAFDELRTAHLAARQARQALAAAAPGSRPVVCYDDEPLAVLLAGDVRTAHFFTDTVLRELLEQPPRERDVLLATLRAWYQADGSTSAAARTLQCHRNTVLNRLHKVSHLTGLDLTAPSATAHLYIALEAHRLTSS